MYKVFCVRLPGISIIFILMYMHNSKDNVGGYTMRFVFVNLHTNFFMVKTVRNYITKMSFAPKHRFLLEYLLKHDYKVACLINRKGNFINDNLSLPTTPLSTQLSRYEYYKVMKKSGLKYQDIEIIDSPEKINSDDIVILYNLFKNNFIDINVVKGVKIGCLLHFFGSKIESNRLRTADVSAVFAENNLLKTSKIFQKNFEWFNSDFLVVPFSFQDRFKKKTDFHDRKNKAIAMGTLTINEIPDFIEVYGSGVYQPLRKQILDNKENLADIIDCYISLYMENDKHKRINSNDSRVVRKLKDVYNMFHTGQQKSYFSFDMVEKYNEYKICIVPEDIQGMPGVGFVEGMACGCAYIGLDYCAYRDYGMIPGVHFIPYDGSLKDLRSKCEYYLAPEHAEELEAIANNGYEFAREHFTSDYVAKLWVDEVLKVKKDSFRSLIKS